MDQLVPWIKSALSLVRLVQCSVDLERIGTTFLWNILSQPSHKQQRCWASLRQSGVIFTVVVFFWVCSYCEELKQATLNGTHCGWKRNMPFTWTIHRVHELRLITGILEHQASFFSHLLRRWKKKAPWTVGQGFSWPRGGRRGKNAGDSKAQSSQNGFLSKTLKKG